MSRNDTRFPLQPLLSVREMRTRSLENELQRCRREQAEAEARRDQARDELRRAGEERDAWRIDTWRGLFEGGAPTGLATARYKQHLALLDQRIVQLRVALEAREKELAQAVQAVEAAATVWRKAWRKLDAVGQMKQGWLREEQDRTEQREEMAMEELMVHRAPAV